MVALGEVVSIRAESYKERLTTWDKFEPLLSRLRQRMNCANEEALRLMGYSGASTISTWRRRGVPILAVNAALGVLSELGIDRPKPALRQILIEIDSEGNVTTRALPKAQTMTLNGAEFLVIPAKEK